MRQQLIDSITLTPDLREAVEELPNGHLRVTGKFQHCGVVNRNNRIYPKTVWEQHLRPDCDFCKAIKERRVIGHIEHPADGKPDLKQAAIVITEVQLRSDGSVWGSLETLSTQAGQTAKALFKDGLSIGISSRAHGSVQRNAQGVDEVQEDFTPESFDLVAEPSTPGAYLRESLEQELAKRGEAQIRGEEYQAWCQVQLEALKEDCLKSSAWKPVWESRINDIRFLANKVPEAQRQPIVAELSTLQEAVKGRAKKAQDARDASKSKLERADSHYRDAGTASSDRVDEIFGFSQAEKEAKERKQYRAEKRTEYKEKRKKLEDQFDGRDEAVQDAANKRWDLVEKDRDKKKALQQSLQATKDKAARDKIKAQITALNQKITAAEDSIYTWKNSEFEKVSRAREDARRRLAAEYEDLIGESTCHRRLVEQAEASADAANAAVTAAEDAAKKAEDAASGKPSSTAEIALTQAKIAAGEAEAAAQAAADAETDAAAQAAAQQAAVAAEKAKEAVQSISAAAPEPVVDAPATPPPAMESPEGESRIYHSVEMDIDVERLSDSSKKKINVFRPGEDLTTLGTLIGSEMESRSLPVKNLSMNWAGSNIQLKVEVDGDPEAAKAGVLAMLEFSPEVTMPPTESFSVGVAKQQVVRDLQEENRSLKREVNRLATESANLKILNNEMVAMFEAEVVKFETAALVQKYPTLKKVENFLLKNKSLAALHEMAEQFRQATMNETAISSPEPSRKGEELPAGSFTLPLSLQEMAAGFPVTDGAAKTPEPNNSYSRLAAYRERKQK